VDEHFCPPRRDNKLVTFGRIAAKYEKFIIANPSWKLPLMKATVQEVMFANISIHKLKRAKALVMKKALDATKGQYRRLYDYQQELLRSNPSNTIVVNKEPNMDPPVFKGCLFALMLVREDSLLGAEK
jgi:alpha-galactosidase